MSIKDRIYGWYQNNVMASVLGGHELARKGDQVLYWLLFKAPAWVLPAVLIALAIILLRGRRG